MFTFCLIIMKDMDINPYLETEDKFINNVKKKSTNNKLCLFEVIIWLFNYIN